MVFEFLCTNNPRCEVQCFGWGFAGHTLRGIQVGIYEGIGTRRMA